MIFSGGMPYDQAVRTPCITVVYSKTTTVLEMEHNVIDFITLCESPYPSGKLFCFSFSLLQIFDVPLLIIIVYSDEYGF